MLTISSAFCILVVFFCFVFFFATHSCFGVSDAEREQEKETGGKKRPIVAVPSGRRPARDAAESVFSSGPHRAPILCPVLTFALA